ncbi:MAG TPA: MFS transporter [Rhizobiaceae bacterium]|nr:MFS transporter [Rhizobiaceae bacterium]
MTTRLAAIATLLIAGIFAGAQLGKIAPLVGWYQQEAGFSLVLIGWLTSMIGIFVALAASTAGWAIDIFGVRRSVVVGSAFLAAGALALTVLQRPEAILAARLVEGLGYLVLVVALPAVLTAISRRSWRAPVLAIWSCFVPVGYAISDLLAQALLPSVGPSLYLLVMAAGYILFGGIGILLLPRVPDIEIEPAPDAATGAFAATINLPVLLVALSFGFFVIQSVSFFTFTPAFIAGGGGLLLSAGAITLFTPVGNVLAGFLVSGAGARGIALIAAIFLALTIVAAYPVFTGASPLVATVCAVAFCIVCGVVGSALFAIIPSIVGRGGSVSIAIGLVAQAGGIGTLFGPPVAAWVIEGYGWNGLGVLLAAIGLAGLVAILPNVLRRPEPATV